MQCSAGMGTNKREGRAGAFREDVTSEELEEATRLVGFALLGLGILIRPRALRFGRR